MRFPVFVHRPACSAFMFKVDIERGTVSKPQCSGRNSKTSAKSRNEAILRAVHLPDKMQFRNSPLPYPKKKKSFYVGYDNRRYNVRTQNLGLCPLTAL